ncbi:MAG: NUDIX domain-containing protein, partial [Verrucomicrobiia bacterium]
MSSAGPPPSTYLDWSAWTPREHGVLLFLLDGPRILLIEKKRGLGAGKVNAPGGRIDPGETPLQAAIRETQEEVGITPLHPTEIGRLHFHFLDGY